MKAHDHAYARDRKTEEQEKRGKKQKENDMTGLYKKRNTRTHT